MTFNVSHRAIEAYWYVTNIITRFACRILVELALFHTTAYSHSSYSSQKSKVFISSMAVHNVCHAPRGRGSEKV